MKSLIQEGLRLSAGCLGFWFLASQEDGNKKWPRSWTNHSIRSGHAQHPREIEAGLPESLMCADVETNWGASSAQMDTVFCLEGGLENVLPVIRSP